jgi:carbamoylphosphate synthase large subunit
MTRSVLITSIGSGSGLAALQSCRTGGGDWFLVGLNSIPDAPGMALADRAFLTPPTAETAAYQARLMDIVRGERPALVVPGRDADLPVLLPMRDELAREGAFLLAGSEKAVTIAGDKYLTAGALRPLGFDFVETAATLAEARSLALRAGYPLLAKPREGNASRGLKLVMSDADLDAVFEAAEPMAVQEYLIPERWRLARKDVTRERLLTDDDLRPGRIRQEAEITVHVILGGSGQVLGSMVHVADYIDGLASRIDVLDDPEALETGTRAVAALGGMGLIGPCNIQGRRVAGRGVAFYEVNARMTGLSGARTALGFREMEAIWRHFVEGEADVDCLHCPPAGTVHRYLTDVVAPSRD